MIRPRRLRTTALMRELVAETRLSKQQFIYPYFVVPGTKVKRAIPSMPGIHHFSVEELLKDVAKGLKSGVNKLLLFGVGEKKTIDASSSRHKNAAVINAIKALKNEFGSKLLIATDVCVCAYTTHGHCGILEGNHIHNDKSVDVLAKMALAHAEAGADIVAPSDMMDGRVSAIRETLDAKGLENTSIMSYSSKYASAYYGPFRDAADSSPQEGDRRSYQMDSRNGREALKESILDESEGADILMVKPAMAYLDVISAVRENTLLPLACYNVSGEYAMVKLVAERKLIEERAVVMENMNSFVRAGADIIISYHTRDIFEKGWL